MCRAGHEAGALSPRLQAELLALGMPVTCVEARHARAAMLVQLRRKGLAWQRMMWHFNLRAKYMIGTVDEVK
jgi:transposase